MAKSNFKVGDTVRRVNGSNSTTPLGFVGVIREIKINADNIDLKFDNAPEGHLVWGAEIGMNWELVKPSVGELFSSVTKRQINLGNFDGLEILDSRSSGVKIFCEELWYTTDELDGLIEKLTVLRDILNENKSV